MPMGSQDWAGQLLAILLAAAEPHMLTELVLCNWRSACGALCEPLAISRYPGGLAEQLDTGAGAAPCSCPSTSFV